MKFKRRNHSFRFLPGVYPRLVAIARFKGLSATGAIESLVDEEYRRLFPPISDAIRPESGAIQSGNKEATQ